MRNRIEHKSVVELLADKIADGIHDGVWNDKLPGYRVLAEKYAVSGDSAAKAIQLLECRGLVSAHERGRPRRILSEAKQVKLKKKRLIVLSGKHIGIGALGNNTCLLMIEEWVAAGGVVEQVQVGMSRVNKPKAMIKEIIKKHRPDALLIYVGSKAWIHGFLEEDIPIYCLGGELWKVMDLVTGSGYAIMPMLIDLLSDLKAEGHTRILLPDSMGRMQLRENRIMAYEEVFEGILSEEMISQSNPIFQENVPAVWQDYWERSFQEVKPSVVILNSAHEVLSLYSFCRMKNIQIPNQLKVVCLAYSADLEWLLPSPVQLEFPAEKAARHFRKWMNSGMVTLGYKEFSLVPHSE